MTTTEWEFKNDVPLLPFNLFKAGHTTGMYESGRIRYIKWKGKEVLRNIYPALRDEQWNTIPFVIRNEKLNISADAFEISYDAKFNHGDISYEAGFQIKGADDKLIFQMRGKALSMFNSKRIGICVLHPVNPCAGQPVDIIRPDKSVNTSQFPVLINSTQPFTDISGMHWVTTGGVKIELNFEGGDFETEDQRNWTDDSYKTYSGPQYKTPMLKLNAGDTMHQKVTLSIKGQAITETNTGSKTGVQEFRKRFPLIGYRRTRSGNSVGSWFADLNGSIPLSVNCDFVSFTACPQVHQTDSRTILENVFSLHSIIETLRSKAIDVPVHVSLLFSRESDHRLHSYFGAWWMINVIAGLSEASHITLYDNSEGSKSSPLYALLNKIHEFRPVNIIAERNDKLQDPLEMLSSGRIYIENETGDRICFTMKDI